MQIDGQHPVGAGRGDQISEQFCRNWRARPGFSVLTRIAIIGNNSGDPARRTAAQSIERNQQFHHVIICRKTGGLHHKNILSTDIFTDLNKHFHIGKALDVSLGQWGIEIGGDSLGQGAVTIT